MPGYGTEEQAMTQGAEAVEQAATTINQQLVRLDGDIQTMFGGWNSDAQRAFQTLHAVWAEQQQRLVTALSQMHDALTQTKQAYLQQEESQSDTFNQMTGNL